MAVSVVQAVKIENGGSGSVTVNNAITTTSGNLLVAATSVWVETTAESASDNLNGTYTRIAACNSGPTNTFTNAIHYARNIIGGLTNLTVTGGTGASAVVGIWHEVSGCDTTRPFLTGESSTTSNAASSTSHTTGSVTNNSNPSGVFFALLGDGNNSGGTETMTVNGASSSPSGWALFDATNSQETDASNEIPCSVAYKIVSSTAASQHQWTGMGNFSHGDVLVFFQAQRTFVPYVGYVQNPGTTGNQAITGLGFQPKIVIFFGVNQGAADGLDTGGATFSLGAAVSSSSRFTVGSSSNNSGVGANGYTRALCIQTLDSGNNTARRNSADLVSMDADGFTLNWTAVQGNIVTNYLALGGADLTNAAVVNFQAPSGTTGNQSITGVGFRPDVVLLASITRSEAVPFLGHPGGFGYSFDCGFGTSSTSRAASALGGGSSDTSFQVTDGIYVAASGTSSTTPAEKADLVSMDSDGFTINWTIGSGSSQIFAICLKGPLFAIGSFNQRTSTGSQSVSGLAFQPQALIVQSFDQTATSVSRGNYSFGAASDSTHRGSTSWSQATNQAQYLSRTAVHTYYEENNAILGQADLTSFDSGGFTLNWGTADSTARQLVYLAMGPVTGFSASLSASASLTARGPLTASLAATASITTRAAVSRAATASATVTMQPLPSVRARVPTGGTAASSAGFTITFPTGTQAGDYVILTVENAGTTGPATPTGWTQLDFNSPGTNASMTTFGAQYASTLTTSFTNAASVASWACGAYFASGVALSGQVVVFDKVAATNNTTNNTTLPTGAPTPAAAGEYEVLAYGYTAGGTTISSVAAGSTIDISQANSTSTESILGHNNTQSLTGSAPTAFSQTLSGSNNRKRGVGILLDGVVIVTGSASLSASTSLTAADSVSATASLADSAAIATTQVSGRQATCSATSSLTSAVAVGATAILSASAGLTATGASPVTGLVAARRYFHFLRHATQKPPVGPLKIDWTHPLSHGLVALIAATEYGSASINEAVSGVQLAANGGVGWGSQSGALGVLANTNGGSFSATAPAQLRLQTPITLVWRGANTATPSSGGVVIFGVTYTNTSTSPFAAYNFAWNNTPSTVVSEFNNGSYQNVVGASRSVGPLWLATTFDANLQSIYCNDPSAPVATNTVAMGGAITYGSTPLLVFGAQPYDARAAMVVGDIGYIYNRVLTPVELAWLKAEPYGMLQARTSLWAGISSGTVTSLASLSASASLATTQSVKTGAGYVLVPMNSDMFTRPNASNIGPMWTHIDDGSGNTFRIVSNTADGFVSSNASKAEYWSTTTWPNDQYCEGAFFDTDTNANGTGFGMELGVRGSGAVITASTTYALNGGHAASTNMFFVKNISGSTTTMGSVTQAWSNNDTWRIIVQGTTISSVYVTGGTTVNTFTDSAISSGNPGFAYFAGGTVTAAHLDNWTGGLVQSAPGLSAVASVFAAAAGGRASLSATASLTASAIPPITATLSASAGLSTTPYRFIATTGTQDAGGNVTTPAIDTTGADLLLMAVTSFAPNGTVTIQDSKSNTWNALTTVTESANRHILTVYWSRPTSVGSGHTFSAGTSGGITGLNGSITAVAFAGSVPSPFDVENHAVSTTSGQTTLATGSITPGRDGELLLAAWGMEDPSNGPNGVWLDSGFLQLPYQDVIVGSDFGLASGYMIQLPPAAAVNPTRTRRVGVNTSGNPSGHDTAYIAAFTRASAIRVSATAALSASASATTTQAVGTPTTLLLLTLASDNFNRADATTLGPNWVPVNAVQKWYINSNRATVTITGSDDYPYYSPVAVAPDQWSRAQLYTSSILGGGVGPGLAVRDSGGPGSSSDYHVIVNHNNTAGAFEIDKVVSGSFSTLSTFVQPWIDGDTWQIDVQGSVISARWLSGTTFVTTTSDSAVTSGQPGLAYSSTDQTCAADNWSGGAFVAGTNLSASASLTATPVQGFSVTLSATANLAAIPARSAALSASTSLVVVTTALSIVVPRFLRHTIQKPDNGPVKLDMSHPLALGLVGAWLFNDYGNGALNSVLNTSDSLVRSAVSSWTTTPWGASLLLDGTSESCVDTTPSAALQPTNTVSMFWMGGFASNGNNLAASFPRLAALEMNNTGVSPYTAYGFLRGTTTDITYFCDTGGNTNSFTSTNVIDTANYGRTRQSYGLTVDSTTGIIRGYAGGAVSGSNTGSIGLLTYSSTALFRLGGHPNDAAAQSGSLPTLVYVWNRKLADADFALLHAEPYVMFEARPIEQWAGYRPSAVIVTPGPSQLALATDNFNRANANPISRNWTTGFGSNPLQIVSNAVTPTVNADNVALYNAVNWPADQYAQARVPPPGASPVDAGMVVRHAAGVKNAYLFTNFAGSSTAVAKWTAGTFSQIASGGTSWASNDIVLLSAIGSTLTLKHNGSSEIVTTDSAFTSGSAGMGIFTTGEAWDDWEGGFAANGPIVSATATLAASSGATASTSDNASLTTGRPAVAASASLTATTAATTAQGVTPQGGLLVLATDTFNRANSTGLGSNWTKIVSGIVSNFNVSGNTAIPSNLGNDNGNYYSALSFPADQYSQAQLTVTGATGVGAGFGPGVRTGSSDQTLYRLAVDHAGSSNVELAKFNGGTYTMFSRVTQAWTDGDTWELDVRATTLTGRWLTTPLISQVDSTISAGAPSVNYSSSETSGSIDNWQGGQATAGPVLSASATLTAATGTNVSTSDNASLTSTVAVAAAAALSASAALSTTQAVAARASLSATAAPATSQTVAGSALCAALAILARPISVVHASNAIAGAGPVTSVTSSPSFSSTAGNLLVTGVITNAGADAATPVDDTGANTWLQSDSAGALGGQRNEIFYARNIAANASETATYHLTTAQFPSIVLIEVSGGDTTTPNDVAATWTTATGTNLDYLLSPAITPAAGNHLLVVVAQNDHGGSTPQTVANAGTGGALWTVIENNTQANMPILLAYAVAATDGSTTYRVSYQPNVGLNPNMVCGIASFSPPLTPLGGVSASATLSANTTLTSSSAVAARASPSDNASLSATTAIAATATTTASANVAAAAAVAASATTSDSVSLSSIQAVATGATASSSTGVTTTTTGTTTGSATASDTASLVAAAAVAAACTASASASLSSTQAVASVASSAASTALATTGVPAGSSSCSSSGSATSTVAVAASSAVSDIASAVASGGPAASSSLSSSTSLVATGAVSVVITLSSTTSVATTQAVRAAATASSTATMFVLASGNSLASLSATTSLAATVTVAAAATASDTASVATVAAVSRAATASDTASLVALGGPAANATTTASASLSTASTVASAASLSASGSLAASGAVAVSASLSASGTLAATGLASISGTATTSATATLTPAVAIAVTVSLNSTATQQATAAIAASTAFSVATTLSATGFAAGFATSTASATGTLATVIAVAASASATDSAALSTVAGPVASSTLSASTALQATGAVAASASLTAAASLAATGVQSGVATATLTATASLTASAFQTQFASATLSASASLTVVAALPRASALTATTVLLALGGPTASASTSAAVALTTTSIVATVGSAFTTAATVLFGTTVRISAAATTDAEAVAYAAIVFPGSATCAATASISTVSFAGARVSESSSVALSTTQAITVSPALSASTSTTTSSITYGTATCAATASITTHTAVRTRATSTTTASVATVAFMATVVHCVAAAHLSTSQQALALATCQVVAVLHVRPGVATGATAGAETLLLITIIATCSAETLLTVEGATTAWISAPALFGQTMLFAVGSVILPTWNVGVHTSSPLSATTGGVRGATAVAGGNTAVAQPGSPRTIATQPGG